VNAEVTVVKTAAEAALAQTFAQARGRLPGDDAIAARREAAFDVFAKQGLPHRRIEEWKYTDLRALMREAKPLANPPDSAAKARAKDAGRMVSDLDARPLVFVDGAFVAELSDLHGLEAGLAVTSLSQALTAGDPVLAARLGKLAPANDAAVALNTALMGDGAVIQIAAGATIERPLHLLFVVSDKPAATFTRSLVMIDQGARVMLIESHEGPPGSDYQVNAALELFAGDGAHVDHVKIIGCLSNSTARARWPQSAGRRSCEAASTPIPRSSPTTLRATAKAAKCSNQYSTAKRMACFRGASLSAVMRKRPTPR
jgi:Fe-S cluster assembly protein SufD